MSEKNPWRLLARYTGVLFVLPSCMVTGYLIGSWLDAKFGSAWMTLLFLLLGAAAGFVQIFRLLGKDP